MESPNPFRVVVINQSDYIPWKGYFELIRAADRFVIFDTAQYTRCDWRNRNVIKTPQGLHWLTVPVSTKGRYGMPIDRCTIADRRWAERHWQTIRHSYRKAPHFIELEGWLQGLYEKAARLEYLSEINHMFLMHICKYLGITTPLIWSKDLPESPDRNERLLAMCVTLGATHYLSGPSARCYMDPKIFAQKGVTVSFAEYTGYRAYPQLHGEFNHNVSILDLLLSVGNRAPLYLRDIRPKDPALHQPHLRQPILQSNPKATEAIL